MKLKHLVLFTTIMLASGQVQGADMPLRVGVRAGVNTSNITETRTAPGLIVDNRAHWEPGVNIGAIVDIAMGRNFYLSPGFYYDYRHDTYSLYSSYTAPINNEEKLPTLVVTTGSVSTNWFHIPMLVSYRIPVKFVEFQFDFGPYISLGLGGHDKYQTTVFTDNDYSESMKIKEDAFGDAGRYFNIDWGFDMGAGMLFANHYYIGAHYLIGARNIAQNRTAVRAAHAHQWQFSIGYNF